MAPAHPRYRVAQERGWSERVNRTLQDRLVNGLLAAQIRRLASANR